MGSAVVYVDCNPSSKVNDILGVAVSAVDVAALVYAGVKVEAAIAPKNNTAPNAVRYFLKYEVIRLTVALLKFIQF